MRLASSPPFSVRRIGSDSAWSSASLCSEAGTWQVLQVCFSTTSRKS